MCELAKFWGDETGLSLSETLTTETAPGQRERGLRRERERRYKDSRGIQITHIHVTNTQIIQSSSCSTLLLTCQINWANYST